MWVLLKLTKLLIIIWDGFKIFFEKIIVPIFKGLWNLIVSFWKALVIIGGYLYDGLVYLWPILYDNAIIPLIKRNFGLILTIYP